MNSNQSSASSDSTAVEQLTQKQQDKSNELFPIVGIAASAGGLEAFTQLLNRLPIDTGMAFVLIQHLDPNQKSLLTEILAKTTQMPVREVQNGMLVEPNQVYVIPPNRKMTLLKGVLQLMPREKIHGKYMPADAFFASLAAEIGSKAISVVLSGSDGDGAQGSEAIKAAGGITFAQCEESAQFSDMPNTAIATGDVDFILPPHKIAEELAKIARHPNVTRLISSQTVEPLPKSETALPAIFAMLFTATGVDFTHYKQTTVKRRIARRIMLYNLESLEDYVEYLQNHPDEVQALYYEILISVTSFFRDPDAYQALKERVFPVISQGKSVDEPIRIWIPGCATGEEVYSIAISLMEFLENVLPKPAIQIFATDINETAIEKARLGIYKPSQIVDVSAERLRRFFNQVESGYQISKPIRELCVFAKQNLISEPPFSNLDLISCRNVLIYFESVLQKQVMPIFHYSLKPTGFLMLGVAESAGEFSNLFTLADRKNNIYTKKLIPTPLNFNFATSNYPVAKIAADKTMSHKTWDITYLNKQADQILLNRYVPVGVMINDNMDILQFRGETSPYLRPAPGVPSFNLFKMARKGLLEELRTAIHQAKRQNISVRKEQIQIEGSEPSRKVNVEVIPFQPDSVETRGFLVLFEDIPALTNPQLSIKPENVEQVGTEEILQLQQELATTKQELAATQEYLQLISQEHEATTQHLKVANEEILSSNEELQSTNEELQTAKEEVQATNEELHTTNQELQSRNLELHNVNNDLLNLLSSVNIPILILTNDLRIRRFTPTAQRLLNLIPTDVGRPLSDIRSTIEVPNLESLIIEVIDTLNLKELEAQDTEGRWYNLRIRPYRTTENQIDGVVMVFMDIDALKRSTQKLQQALDYAEAVVETMPEPLVVLNADLQVIKSNRAFYRMFQVTPAQTEQQLIFELGNGHWNIPQVQSILEEILTHNTQIEGFEVCCDFEKIGQKTILLNGYKILQPGNQQMILLALHDITQQKLFEEERAQLLAQEQSARLEAEASNRTKDEFLSLLSHELRNPLHNILGWSDLLQKQNFDTAQMNRAIDMIQRSAKAQVQMIEDLLDISRITTGKLHLNIYPIDLRFVIEAALEIVRLSAEAKNIQIECHLQPMIRKVLGDGARLQQVIWNLLSNAIKFTPAEGSVVITLEEVNSQAQIRVSDTGIGIPNDFLPYVFDRFRQADSSKTRANQGLGIGLSLVRYLVELHGGTVQAESPGVGLGTTIIVKLPLNSNLEEDVSSADPEVIDIADDAEISVDNIPSLEGLHVLVVDDDADIRELTKMILKDYGAEVTAVTSADEAFSILTSQPQMYDLLLSDIGMPNQDGYTLIRRVRSLSAEAGGQIPAVAMTGYANSIDIQESRKAGFQMYIPKPVELTQLVFMVANLARQTKNT
ncbi:PAS domain-containing protein [Nostoc spongiaeforme FACHB-130]|uniref:PAS domain-containing protein n=1 Tax=Nostoc spongiaeforme FACHB-130 TaxID=1357510 RepID=A0ABR8FSW7_9NOSO|nr:chemotaxis protein CheB [Nostoc spongiaeforme]MBD2594540.1 PAS domain-containing protein [Nostoc spongiaeforme FACHB-130]